MWWVIGLAFILRLWGINQSFWLDEASQAQLSALPLAQIWSGREGDFHPPLYYLLAHFWMQVNTSEVWLRLLPLFTSLVGVGLMYKLTDHLLPKLQVRIGKWVLGSGMVGSFLLAINPFHIYYSQEFRMYSLLATLGIWIMLEFVKKGKWLWLALALAFYTHYASFVLVLALILYCLIFERGKLKHILLSLGGALLAYLPWIPHFLAQLNSGVNIDKYLPGWREVLAIGPLKSMPLVVFKLVAGRIDFLSRTAYAIYIAFVLGFTGFAGILASHSRKLLLSWLIIPVTLSIVVSFVLPLTQPFRLIFVLPTLILIFVQAVARFPRLSLLLLCYISTTALVMYATRPRLQREQWRQAGEYLRSVDTLDSRVVVKFSGNFAPLVWYQPDLEVLAAVPQYPARIEQVSRQLAPLQRATRVYLVNYLGELTDPYNQVEKYLDEEGFTKDETVNFEGVGFIDIYNRLSHENRD